MNLFRRFSSFLDCLSLLRVFFELFHDLWRRLHEVKKMSARNEYMITLSWKTCNSLMSNLFMSNSMCNKLYRAWYLWNEIGCIYIYMRSYEPEKYMYMYVQFAAFISLVLSQMLVYLFCQYEHVHTYKTYTHTHTYVHESHYRHARAQSKVHTWRQIHTVQQLLLKIKERKKTGLQLAGAYLDN